MKRMFLLLLAVLLLPACGGVPEGSASSPLPAPAEERISFTDGLGQDFALPRPRKVAALIGSFADIWCLAGGRETLVAAANDAWTSFDLSLDGEVADLGAVKEPNLELLLAQRPDLILASVNTAADLELQETFQKAGIPAAYFDIQGVQDYLDMLDVCTQLTGQRENYQRYGLDVLAQVEAACKRADGSRPTVLCIRATGSSCKAKGSTDNVLGEMLAGLDCVNIADREGALLDDLSLESILLADPDYIFAVLQGADPSRAEAVLERTLLSNPAWSGLRAVREGRFYTLDHRLYNLKPNARWGEAYEQLADILYGAE